ncbi:MAG: lipoate--protein ligase family protein [Acidaminococcaceae bacterium]
MTTLMKWRLLDTGLATAAENMAIDEALLLSYQAGNSLPTLRFYGWQPAAVSLGYFQHGERELDFAACAEQGLDIVRRLTGGRAVLHHQEVTYSMVVGEAYPQMPRTITASYRYLSQGLQLGLAKLGVTAQMTKPQATYARRVVHQTSAACFDAPSHYELTVQQRKLIGSAQVRKQGVILQHGSVLLDFSATQLAGVLNLTAAARSELGELLTKRVMTLTEALQRPVSYEEVKEALTAGVAEMLGIEFVCGSLTAAERATAQELTVAKYSKTAWTKKR